MRNRAQRLDYFAPWSFMHNLLYWGDELNWMPIVGLGMASVIVFLTRMLTVSIFLRRLAVPALVSSLYFLSGVAMIIAILWGLVRTAWWMLPLGFVSWFIIHRPFRDAMEAWATLQRTSMAVEDSEALLRGGLTAEEEKTIKNRLGLDK